MVELWCSGRECTKFLQIVHLRLTTQLVSSLCNQKIYQKPNASSPNQFYAGCEQPGCMMSERKRRRGRRTGKLYDWDIKLNYLWKLWSRSGDVSVEESAQSFANCAFAICLYFRHWCIFTVWPLKLSAVSAIGEPLILHYSLFKLAQWHIEWSKLVYQSLQYGHLISTAKRCS